jgi:hypothetical protein
MALSLVVLCLGVFIGTQFTGLAEAAPPQLTEARQGERVDASLQEAAPNAPSDQMLVECTVRAVGVNYITNDVGIHITNCTPSTDAITAFVVIGTDTKKANQVLSVGLTARATGRPVGLIYDTTDTNGLACSNYCRKLLTIAMN